jgi:serralysin
MNDLIRACCELPRRPPAPTHAEEMAAQTEALWEPGTTLRIAFRGGTSQARLAVMRAARIWMALANIQIVRSLGPCEIRCSFDYGGSWSYVGREILGIPEDAATMNIGWPNDPGRDLHELGHTLGLIHEHQSPAASIPWNREAVYAFYGQPPNSWSRDQVDAQVFGRYEATKIISTQWDGKSIMEYPIPEALVTDPKYAVGWNQTLSVTDMAYIAKLYPIAKA